MHKGIILRLQEKYGQLRKSERLVADYLRANASQRLDMSITEFANTLDISEATISRFTRALGYKGFSDMKLALASESVQSNQFANLPAEMKESDPLDEVSFKLLGALGAAMSETQKHIDYSNVQKVVDHVLASQHVVFMGVGGAVSVCEEAVHLLLKAGIQATTHRDGYTQQVVATTSSENVTVFGVSHTGTTEDVAKALRVARENGAKTIAITSNLESSVAEAAEISLWTWTPNTPQIPLYGDFLEGRVCQIYIVYLIYLGVLFQSGGKAPESLEATAESLKRYFLRS
ncbi:MAG: MurR/RpiR family transcriptional regulator [Hyphomicrobiales bacterium]